jgi:hypothetical protein
MRKPSHKKGVRIMAKCPGCGRIAWPEAQHCSCGYQFARDPASAETSPPADSADSDSSFIAFIIAIPLGIVWLFLWSRGGEPEHSFYVALFLVAGPLGIAAALFNWDWFFDHPTARPWVRRLGRGGARLLYLLLGSALTGVGIWLWE